MLTEQEDRYIKVEELLKLSFLLLLKLSCALRIFVASFSSEEHNKLKSNFSKLKRAANALVTKVISNNNNADALKVL